MKEPTENKVRAAWYGPLTADRVAARFRISGRLVRAFWRAEIMAARLPLTPRPYFVKFAAKLPAPLPPAASATSAPPAPASPSNVVPLFRDDGAGVIDLRKRDALLDRLKAVHGDDLRRQVETRLADTLGQTDASKRHKPPRIEIARMVRGLDHFMRGASQHAKERRP